VRSFRVNRHSKGLAMVCLVVTPECQQALHQLLQGREIVGRQDLSLEDREIDFDLIEPTGVNGPVNEHQVGIFRLKPSDCPEPRCAEPLSTIQKTLRAWR